MKCDFYTLTYNNVIIATAYSKEHIDKLLAKLKQNPKYLKDLVRHKRVIVFSEKEHETQKLIDGIKDNKNE